MSRARCTSAPNARRLAATALALAAALAIAACGGGGHAASAARKASPGVLLAKTFRATGAIQSGHVDLHLGVALDGGGSGPFSLEVSGPFSRSGGHTSTDLAVTLTAASKTRTFGLDVVDGALYVGVGGTFYEVPANALHHMAASGASGATGATSLFASLGIDPRSWLTDPHDAGTASVGGVQTERFSAGVDVQKLFADLSKVVAQRLAGATGASGSASNVATELQLVASAITRTELDVYTGTADHVIRRVHVGVAFKVPSAAAALVNGLTGGSLDFDATLTQLNAPQNVTAPPNPQPISALGGALSRLGLGAGSFAHLPLTTLG